MENIRKNARNLAHLVTARHILPAILLLLSLLVTYNLWRGASAAMERDLRIRFDFRVRELTERIYQRLQTYEQVLRGAQGLYAASQEVTRPEFNAYVGSLRLKEHYPGMQGIGFAQMLWPAQKEGHVQAMRKAGFPEYKVWPEGERELYTAIIYLEPFSGRNLRAFGYDMYSEPVRQAAMAQARDSGNTAITGKTVLVQENGTDVQTGFLMYLPVYRNDTPRGTLPERRANLAGWVYAPFRMNDLMLGIQGAHAADLDIEIYDGDAVSDAALMYDSSTEERTEKSRSILRSARSIELGGHRWLLVATALPVFEQTAGNDRAALILRGGVGISLLLALLMWVSLDDRARAIQAADQAYRLALYDTLTGLPNRKLITERLEQTLAKARRDHRHFALIFIDLDKFKPVNDEYGHAVGDLLLKDVARRLQACMRESDTAARVGGDEFIVLLPEVDGKASAAVVAEKILHAMAQPFEVAGHVLEIAASIGVAMYPEDATDQKELVRCADLAMYRAKNEGRNAVRFAQGC